MPATTPSEAPEEPVARRSWALESLTYAEFRLLIAGFAVSHVGTWMQTYALGWYVVQLAVREGTPERAPLYVGLIAGSRGVPVLLVGLVGGAVSDRTDRRRLLLIVQVIGASIAGSLAALELTGNLGLPALVIATVAAAIVGGFDSPSRIGMVPSLVPPRALASAIGLTQGVQNIATVLGPLAGGILLTTAGVGTLLLCTASLFLLSIVAIAAMHPLASMPAARAGSVLQTVRDGFDYVRRDPVMAPIFFVLVVISLTSRPIVQLLPAFAENRLHVGAIELSWMLGAAGGGAFAGSLLSASLGGVRRQGLLVLLYTGASGSLVLALAAQTTLLPALVLMGLTSVVLQGYVTSHMVVHQTRAPVEMRGRVIGTSFALGQGSMALGSLTLGSLAAVAGLDVTLGVAGGLLLLASCAMVVRFPRLRDYETAPGPPATSSAAG